MTQKTFLLFVFKMFGVYSSLSSLILILPSDFSFLSFNFESCYLVYMIIGLTLIGAFIAVLYNLRRIIDFFIIKENER